MKILSVLTAVFAAFAISHAQSEPNQEIYSKVVIACQDNKAVKTGLAQITKKNEKVVDAYDKSERNEKAKYERNTSEIDIVSAEGPKIVKFYAECMKSKLQGKEFREQGNKLTAKVSVTNDGRLVNNSTTTTERPVKKGKPTKVGNPTITQGKSFWCEDEMNKCLQATIVIEQK